MFILFSHTVLQDVWTWEPEQRVLLYEQLGQAAGGQGVQRIPEGGHRKLQ